MVVYKGPDVKKMILNQVGGVKLCSGDPDKLRRFCFLFQVVVELSKAKNGRVLLMI